MTNISQFAICFLLPVTNCDRLFFKVEKCDLRSIKVTKCDLKDGIDFEVTICDLKTSILMPLILPAAQAKNIKFVT